MNPAPIAATPGIAMPKIAVMMAAWLTVISGYENRQVRNTATIMAISETPTPVNNAATGHDRWAATTLAIKSAATTEIAALIHRIRGRRIKSAAAIAQPGQKSVMPPGTRVSNMDMQEDTSVASPTSISFNGALFNAFRILAGFVGFDGTDDRGMGSSVCRRSSRSARRKASSF